MAIIVSKEQNDKTLRMRRVFHSPEGRQTFKDMILDLGLFDSIEPSDTEAIVRRNYALSLCYDMGILIDTNVDKLVDKMLELEYTPIVDEKIQL